MTPEKMVCVGMIIIFLSGLGIATGFSLVVKACNDKRGTIFVNADGTFKSADSVNFKISKEGE